MFTQLCTVLPKDSGGCPRHWLSFPTLSSTQTVFQDKELKATGGLVGQGMQAEEGPHLRGMKRMPLMTLSCSKTLAMLGAVNLRGNRENEPRDGAGQGGGPTWLGSGHTLRGGILALEPLR